MAVKRSLSEHNKKSKIKLQQQELMEMERDEFLQAIRSPFHFATCDAVLRGCKIVDISEPLQWRRLSKKVRSPLGPPARGHRLQAVGERTSRLSEMLWAQSKFSPSGPAGPPSSRREASLLYQQINQESITVAVLPIPTVASAIFFQLAQPHTPSAVRPNRRWHALSAFSVAWPKMPSSVFVV